MGLYAQPVLFSPPLFLIGIYILQRMYWKSRNFTLKAGLCFVLSAVLFGIYIDTGWQSCIHYVMYEDVLLEKAIAQYENPPQELINYHYADGGRNMGAFALGGFYAIINMIIWSPILLIFWLIEIIFRRWKLKAKSQPQVATAG